MSEPDVSELISVARAIDILDAVPVFPRIIELPLADAADHRLAHDLLADRDQPPFDKAVMDGFAVKSSDVESSLTTFHVTGEIAAGASSASELSPGQAIAIMTGAPVPAGADCIIPIENIDGQWARPDPSKIKIIRANSKSRNIAGRGSDCRAGDCVLQKGTLLTPAAIAVAASIGAHRVNVFSKPRTAVLSTGNEIVPTDQTPGPSQIRNSNSPMLAALLTQLGCDVTDLGIVPDQPDLLLQTIFAAINSFDLLFISGGMSMGQHDHIPAILNQLQLDLKITKLRIKPGKPFLFATHHPDPTHHPDLPKARVMTDNGIIDQWRDHFVFGLPGNPVSAFVCTLRLASRLIARMTGAHPPEPSLHALLAKPLPANGPREFYQPLQLTRGDATPLPWRGSADIFTLAKADAFLIREENAPALPAGSPVLLLPIPGRDELRA